MRLTKCESKSSRGRERSLNPGSSRTPRSRPAGPRDLTTGTASSNSSIGTCACIYAWMYYATCSKTTLIALATTQQASDLFSAPQRSRRSGEVASQGGVGTRGLLSCFEARRRARYLAVCFAGEQVADELVKLTVENPTLREGALSAAFEEYVEAKCFCYYLDTGRLLPRRDLSAATQKHEYLGGVIDFTGTYPLPGSVELSLQL